MAFAMSLSGLAFSFTKAALYSSALLSYFPVMFVSTITLPIAQQNGFSHSMKAYG